MTSIIILFWGEINDQSQKVCVGSCLIPSQSMDLSSSTLTGNASSEFQTEDVLGMEPLSYNPFL